MSDVFQNHREKLAQMEADRQAAIAAQNLPITDAQRDEVAAEAQPETPAEPAAPAEAQPETPAEPEAPAEAQPETPAEEESDARRLRDLYAKNRQLERARIEAQRELEILRKQREPSKDETIALEARRIADEQSFITNFNNNCEQVAQKGLKEFKDFGEAVSSLWSAVGPIDQNVPFVEAIFAAGEADAHKLVRWLGNNPDEAERIAKLPPVQAGVSLAKISEKLKQPTIKPVSKMPPPVTPLATPGAGVSKKPDAAPKTAAEYAARKRELEYQERLARNS